MDKYYLPYSVNVLVINDNWDISAIQSRFEDMDGTYDGPLYVTDINLLPNLLVKLKIYESTSKAIQAGRKGKIPPGFEITKANKLGITLYTYNPISPIEDVIYILETKYKRIMKYLKNIFIRKLTKFKFKRKGLKCEQFTSGQVCHLESIIDTIFSKCYIENKGLISHQLKHLFFYRPEMYNRIQTYTPLDKYLTKKQMKFLLHILYDWKYLYPINVFLEIIDLHNKIEREIYDWNKVVINEV